MDVVLFQGAICLFSGNAGDAVDDVYLLLIDDKFADLVYDPLRLMLHMCNLVQ